MNRETYFSELLETSRIVLPDLRNYLRNTWKTVSFPASSRSKIENSRLSDDTLLLKPFLLRLSFEAAGGSDWRKISNICAAMELLNISSYQTNLSFDGKFRVLNQDDRSNEVIAAFLSREAIQMILDDSRSHLGDHVTRIISARFSLSNRSIYIGQHLDLNKLSVANLSQFRNLTEYSVWYIERCQNLSGVFSRECCRIGALLAGANLTHQRALAEFGFQFGTGLQIMNDLGDFVPASELTTFGLRMPCDQFGDLRKGKLTLPIAYMLMNAKSADKEFLLSFVGSDALSISEMRLLVRLLNKTGALSYTKLEAKNHMKRAKKALSTLSDSVSRTLLSVMASQIRSNKFVSAFRSILDEGRD